VDSAENDLTRIIRVGYGRVHPVEIFAVRMKTATEPLRPALFPQRVHKPIKKQTKLCSYL
jgi:hypothetical protein